MCRPGVCTMHLKNTHIHNVNPPKKVTELPVKRWTQDYKQFLESMTVGASDEKGAFVKVSPSVFDSVIAAVVILV